MASNRIVYTLDFKANFQDVQGQLNSLRTNLSKLVATPLRLGGAIGTDLEKASQAAISLQTHLKKALDPNTGKLDLSRLQVQLKASGQSASQLGAALLRGGQQGVQAFMDLGVAINNAQKPMHRFSQLTRSLGQTLMNTIKWQISSRVLYGFIGAFSNSLNYAKELDKSLTSIRTITGESKETMFEFAEEANKAAKALSSSTVAFTNAALIYRQQGDTAAEASKKAEITLKAANATGLEAKEMSEYLTGVWNSYQVGTENLELFVDKLVRVGAVTATSAAELSTSMTKVAATANAVGVTYDQLLGTISTVSAATRLSAEQVGTAFKTIYARMGDLELEGSIDEDGVITTLGSISSQLKQVGVNVLDANGNIKDMGTVVEDLGTKWQSMSGNQKTAIAEAVAGKRQYTQLFALFENWDEYKRAVNEASDAQGELNDQQLRWADSIEGAQARLKAAKEDFLLDAIDAETIKSYYDTLTIIVSIFDGAIESVGGLKNILLWLGSYLTVKFAPQIGQKLTDMWGGFLASVGLGTSKAQQLREEVDRLYTDAQKDPYIQANQGAQKMLEFLKEENKIQLQLDANMKKMNETQREKILLQKKALDSTVKPQIQQAFSNYTQSQQDTTNAKYALMGNRDVRQLSRVSARTFSQGPLAGLNISGNMAQARQEFEQLIQVLVRTDAGSEAVTASTRELAEAITAEGGSVQNVQRLITQYIEAIQTENGSLLTLDDLLQEVRSSYDFLSAEIDKSTLKGSAFIAKVEELSQKLLNLNKQKSILSSATNIMKDSSNLLSGAEGKSFSDIPIPEGRAETYQTVKDISAGKFDKTAIQNALKTLPADAQGPAAELKRILENTLNIADDANKFKKDGETFKETLDRIGEEAEDTKRQMDGMGGNQSALQGTISAIGGLSSVMMGLSMAVSSVNTLFDEDATIMERVMAGAMILSSTTSILMGIEQLRTSNLAKGLIVKITNKLLTLEQAKANMAETATTTSSTIATVGRTVATWALNAAITVLKILTGDVSAGVAILTGAIIAGTAAIIAFIGGLDKGEKQLRNFKKAEEELKTIDENISRIEEEQSALLKLQETMVNCDKSVESLAQVENELNEALGTQFDLVNGGASEYERANAMLQERIKLSREELELEKDKRAENFATQSGNLTAKSAGSFWKASTSDNITHEDMQALLKNIKSKGEDYEKNFFAGEYGTETLKAGSAGYELFDPATIQEYKAKLKEITTEQLNEAFRNIDSPIQSDMKQMLIDMRLSGASDEEMSRVMNTYVENAKDLQSAVTEGNSEKARQIMNKIKNSIPVEMEEVRTDLKKSAKDIQNEIKAANEAGESSSKYQNTELRQGIKAWTDEFKNRSEIIKDFQENGYLSSDSVANAIEMLGIKFSDEEKKQIQNYLNGVEVTSEGISQIFDEILNRQVLTNEQFKQNLLNGEKDLAEQLLRDSGIANASEIVDRYEGIYNALEKIKIETSGADVVDNTEKAKTVLEELTNQYGYTESAALALITQENIFNNHSLDVSQKIAALKMYAEEFYKATNPELYNYIGSLSDENVITKWEDLSQEEQKRFSKIGYHTDAATGNIVDPFGNTVDEDTGVYVSLLATQAYYESQYNIQASYVNQTQAQLDKLNREHQKALADWEKENILEKIKDSILELQEAIEVFNRKTESLEFMESLFGENTPIDVYIQKINNFKNITNEAVKNWDSLMQMEATDSESMEEILSAKQETLQAWRDSIINAREAEDQLYEARITLVEEAGAGLNDVIEKQHELISITLEGMQKLLELNESGGSSVAKKGALAEMIGQVAGALSEYDKEIRKQERASKKRLDIRNEETQQILEMNQKMEDEINKYALDALKQGIKDRQTERNTEREDIIKDYNDTVQVLEERMSQAALNMKTMFEPILNEIREMLGILSTQRGKSSATDTTLTKEFMTPQDAYYNPLLKGKSTIQSIDRKNNIVSIKNWDAKNKNWRHYDYKFRDGEINEDLHFGDEISSGTVLAKNTSGYTVTKPIGYQDYGEGTTITDLEKERFGYSPTEQDIRYFHTTSINHIKDNKYQAVGEIHSQFNKKIGTFSLELNTATIMPHYDTSGNVLEGISFLGPENPPISLITGTSITPDELEKVKLKGGAYGVKISYGYASGADSTLAGEAWIGELGRELIILPDGKVVMAGEDGIELANLPAGARVLTNEETEKILKNKKDYTNVQESEIGFAQGTQFHVNEQNLTQETVDFNAEYFSKDVENYKTATDEKLNIQDTFKKETNQTLSDIESATIKKNKEIKDNTTTSLSVLDIITQSTASKIEGYINNMEFVIPKIDSKEFIDSLEKLIDDSLKVVYEDQDITITDASGKTHTGKYSSGGIGGSELGEIRGSSVEIGQGVTTYDDLFVKYGKAYGIDPRFLKAISGIETNFGKNINTSGAGAKGLMQFIDSTAKAYGVDVTNPDSSVRGAAQYLSELLAKYNGNLILAGRAYNGGTPNKSRENLNYGKMLEECFGKDATNEDLLKTSKIRVNSFAELLAHIAGLNTNFIEKDGWIDPVLNGYISSDYQPQGRYNKQTGKTRPHMGIDIVTASNSAVPLYATKDGVIITNQFDKGGYGNWVRFQTDDGYIVGYGHMLNPSSYKVGSKIKQGDIIGYMGSTGLSSGIHLDYHVQKNGSYIDPKTVMPSYAVGGTTKAGKALVGEYGKEIILYPDGTAGLLGENGMEYAELPAGAHIIPAEETAKILNNPVNKTIPAYAEGTELNLGNDTNLSMERDYLKVTLSPEEVSYLKKIYNVIDESKDEVTSELHQALQNRASEMGYSTLRDVLVETFGYEDLAKRDFKNYKKSMMNVEGFEYIQGLEKDYLTQVFSPDEIVFLKSLFKLKDTSEAVTDELHATMQGRAKDRGYGTLRDVGVEIYGEEGMLKREWESGYSTKFSVEQLKALQDDITTSFREFYGDEIISDLLNLWKLDPSSEEFEIETDRQQLDTIFKSRDFYQQQVDELVAQLETYEDFVARGIIARNDKYRAILSEAIEKTGQKLEDIDSQFQNRLDTKIEALEKYYDEYNRKYERMIANKERSIETLEGRKGVWETYYSEYNELLDTQHSINKELQKSKTLTQWLDAKTREQVFNEKDYLQYTQKINEHMLEAEKDRLKYEREIRALGTYESEKIALLTEEYQERVELRKKELNILKEELQLQKKQNELNTALMERNVRVFSGGRWIQIANVENVAKAQEDLEETKYNISKAERELDQTSRINDEFNEEIRKSKEIIADWNASLTEAKEKMDDAIHDLTTTIDIGKGNFQDLFDEIDSVMKQLRTEKKAFENGEAAPKTIKSSSGSGSVLSSTQTTSNNAGEAKFLIGGNLITMNNGVETSRQKVGSKMIQTNAIGTRDSQSGLSLVNENGIEMLSTKFGQIIELNPHQKIFNNDQLNYLYDISRDGIAGMSRTVSAMTANSNIVSIDTLHIALDNVTNAESFIDGLKNLNQYIKNTRTINRS